MEKIDKRIGRQKIEGGIIEEGHWGMKETAHGKERTFEIYKELLKMRSSIDIIKEYVEKWGITESGVRYYIKRALKIINESVEKNAEKILSKQISVMSSIAESAIKNDDRSNAIKAVTEINKLYGLYTEKIDMQMNGKQSINVNFGGWSVDDDSDKVGNDGGLS